MKVLCFLVFISIFSQVEDIRLPKHKINTTLHQAIISFIPHNYVILDQCDGDLNGDNVPDKILILRCKAEITEQEKRPIIILIGQKNHTYIKLAENDNIVLSLSDGGIHGDPYHGITIKNGCFSIEHFGGSSWRWNQIITFKYHPTQKIFYLNKIGSENWHFDPSQNFKSEYQNERDFGKVRFVDYKNKWREKDK